MIQRSVPGSTAPQSRPGRGPGTLLLAALAALAGVLTALPASATITVEGYYKLGEAGSYSGSKNLPQDSSGKNTHFVNGSASGATIPSPAVNPAPGSTAYFVFSGGQVYYDTNGYVPPLNTNIGFECWARVSNLAQGEAFVFGEGQAGNWTASSGVGIIYNGASGFQGMVSAFGSSKEMVGTAYKPSSVDEWVHLAIIWEYSSSRTARFYVNGVQSGPPRTLLNANGAVKVCLGASQNSAQFFNGAIDEARMFTFTPGQFNPGADLLYWTGVGASRYGFGHPRPFVATNAYESYDLKAKEFLSYSGWNDLWSRYAGLLPSGAGVTVAQVESNVPAIAQFADKTITLDPSNAVPNTGHPTTVGKILYGTPYSESWASTFEYGFSRGASDIVAYEGNAFKQNALHMQVGSDTRLPGLPAWNLGARDVLNISNSMGNGGEAKAIRALDYLLDTSNTLACTAHPENQLGAAVLTNESLSGNLWNSIVVAQNSPFTQFWSGAKYENVGTNFRVKPDLVTSTYSGGRVGAASSWATPTVASGAGFLIEAARTNAMPNATTNYVMKSILLAGASKQGLVTPVMSGNQVTGIDLVTPYTYTTNPPAQPLDRMYGAGLFNINNAFSILMGGEQTAGVMTNKTTGWAKGINLTSAGSHVYGFNVTTPKPDFCAVLTWNRHITENGTTAYNWSVSNLKLELYNAANQLLASSDDPGNNVEQIYLPLGLAAGSYYLKVSSPSAAAETYGLAWRTVSPKFAAPQLALQKQTGTTMKVSFQGVPKQPYNLFRSPSLQSGTWTFLGTLRPDNDGAAEFNDAAAPAGKGFYRVYHTQP